MFKKKKRAPSLAALASDTPEEDGGSPQNAAAPPKISKHIEPHPLTAEPDRLWKLWKSDITAKPVKPISPDKPIRSDHLRCVCISDTHANTDGLAGKIPPGDVLLHAGDFTMISDPIEVEHFRTFLDSLPHRLKLVIAGNHDIIFDAKFYDRPNLMRSFGCPMYVLDRFLERRRYRRVHEALLGGPDVIYLQDTGVDICGVHFHGAPWQPEHYGCGFSIRRGRTILSKWNKIPDNTQVLITHGPPLGFGDLVARGVHVGCAELLSTVRHRVKPEYHVFGHIHEGYGSYSDGTTRYINASTCDKGYRPYHQPIVFDIAIPTGHSKEELAVTDYTVDPDYWGIPPHSSNVNGPAGGESIHEEDPDIPLPDNSGMHKAEYFFSSI